MTTGWRWLAIEPGARVQCPRRNEEVELTRCLECNWVIDLDRAAGIAALRCAAVSPVADGRHISVIDRHVD